MSNLSPFDPYVINLDDNSCEQSIMMLDYAPISSLQLRFNNGASITKINIGALHFLRRTKPKSSAPANIDKTTYSELRESPLMNWAIALIEKHARHLQPASLYAEYGKVASFIEWSDSIGHTNVLDSCLGYHGALIAYSRFLCANLALGGKRNVSQRKLVVALMAADELFPDNQYNFKIDLMFPGYDTEESTNTLVPTDDVLMPALRSARSAFEVICDFFESDRNVPVAYEKSGNVFWITSGFYPVMSEKAILCYQIGRARGSFLSSMRREVLAQAGDTNENKFLDFKSVVQRLVLEHRYIQPSNGSYRPINNTLSNDELKKACIFAHDCFLFMFVLYTEANISSVGLIPWDDEFSIEVTIQRFRSVKWRSHSEVDVSFEAKFSVLFRRFIIIRKYLVGEHDYRFLFGSFSTEFAPRQIGYNHAELIAIKLKRLVDPDIEKLGFRELRAYHHHFKTNNGGLEISAAHAQHSMSTAIKSYLSGSFSENIGQIERYFSSVGGVLFELENKNKLLETQAGSCNGELIPSRQLDEGAIQPNCRDYLGCLFCESHLFHFDKKDAWKLLSMAYVIEQLRQTQISHAEHAKVFDATLIKIYWIIDEMEKVQSLANDIYEIRIDVFERENLSPYWQNKLRLYVDIGVL